MVHALSVQHLLEKKAARQRSRGLLIMASQEEERVGAAGEAAGDVRLFPDRPLPLVCGKLAKALKAHQVRASPQCTPTACVCVAAWHVDRLCACVAA